MADLTKLLPVPPREWTVLPTDRQLSTIRFSHDGKLLLGAGRDGTIRRWDLSLAEAPAPGPLPIDPKTKKPVKPTAPELPQLDPLKHHNGWVTDLAFAKEPGRFYSADSWGELACWSLAGKEAKIAWQVAGAHDGWLRRIAQSPDGKTLATAGRDQRVVLWSAADGKKLRELVGHNEDVYSVAFHPSGKSLVSGDMQGVVKEWSLEGKPLREFDARSMFKLDRLQDVGGARLLNFDPQGESLLVAGTKPESGGFVNGVPVILVFDWKSAALKNTISIGTNRDVYVQDLQWHPAGYLAGVTSGQPGDGNLFFQQLDEKEPFFKQKLPNCHSLAIHPEGYRVAVISNGGIFGQVTSKGKSGDYPGNFSPVNLWDLPKAV